MTAREHAIVASQLLENLDSASMRLREHLAADPMNRVEASVTGLISRHNADATYTLELAHAHAAAALALAATEDAE